jgi:uncharacterized protein
MKKLLLPILLFLASVAIGQIEKVIPPQPVPPRLVVDLTGTLAPDQRDALEAKLVAYDDTTSNQIAVVIIPTTGDYDISEVAYMLGRKWGVGNKEFNNGIVFLVAKNDRKVFIATGYGLEGAIPDIIVENETGFLVEPQNPYMLADKLSVLLNDKELRIRMGQEGYKRYLANYTIDKFEKNIFDTIQTILSMP